MCTRYIKKTVGDFGVSVQYRGLCAPGKKLLLVVGHGTKTKLTFFFVLHRGYENQLQNERSLQHF